MWSSVNLLTHGKAAPLSAAKRWVKDLRLCARCLHYRAIAAHLRNQNKRKLLALAQHLPAQNTPLDLQYYICGMS
jgi:hypothetical protein